MNNNYVTMPSHGIDTVEKFLKLVTSDDRRRTPIFQASTFQGVPVVQHSTHEIEEACDIIRRKRALKSTSLSLINNYYGEGLMKIDRKVSLTKTMPPQSCTRKRKRQEENNRVVENPQILNSRSFVNESLIMPHNQVLGVKNTWDVHIMKHKATYYNGLIFKNMPSLLEEPVHNCASNIDPAHNRDVGVMPGINTSMYYLACAGSYSEMHVEDSNLESLNVVCFNLDRKKPNAISKIWIIIPEKENCLTIAQQVNSEYEAVRESTRGEDSERPDCCQFLDRKDCYVTLEFLKQHKIYYYLVKQKPGDVMYINRGVLHQVINVNANFAEAINFGSAKWIVVTICQVLASVLGLAACST